jgi:hypothetical protein
MEYRKLSTLKKLEGNPRIIRDKQFQNLVASIKENPKFFESRPLILSNRTGSLVIIAGNQRYEAAKAAGLKEAPTYLMEGITEEKEREITIRDNTQQGAWDMDALANNWSDLPLVEWGVDLPEDWLKAVDGIDAPALKDGDRAPFIQMTFTLHDTQAEELNAAISKAKGEGGAQSAVNENSNGNALAFIAERFNRG